MLSWVLLEVAKHRKKRSTCMQRHRYFRTREYARILVSLSFCQTPGCYCRQKRPCWPEGRKSFGRWQSCHSWPEALLCLRGAGKQFKATHIFFKVLHLMFLRVVFTYLTHVSPGRHPDGDSVCEREPPVQRQPAAKPETSLVCRQKQESWRHLTRPWTRRLCKH